MRIPCVVWDQSEKHGLLAGLTMLLPMRGISEANNKVKTKKVKVKKEKGKTKKVKALTVGRIVIAK